MVLFNKKRVGPHPEKSMKEGENNLQGGWEGEREGKVSEERPGGQK